jgi:hypothetical protein
MFITRNGAVKQREFDISGCRRPAQQLIALEDEADFRVANFGQMVAIERLNINSAEPVDARSREIEATEDIHERRFSGPRWSHDGDELTAIGSDGNSVERRK